MQSCSAVPPTGLEYSLLRCQWCPVLSQQMFFRIVHKNLPHSSLCVQDLNLSIEQPLCEGHKTLETRGKGYKRFIFTQQYCVLNISFEDGKRLTELYLDMTTKPKLRGWKAQQGLYFWQPGGPTGTLEELQRSTASARESVDREAIS